MSTKLRQDKILEILEKQGYSTVKYLGDTLHYSTATINRDLNDLQKRGLVQRSYGGVELVHSPYVPILSRVNKMRSEKRHIAKAAASFVCDGDTIFIDGSTTAQCMEEYLIEKKRLTVITNNIMLVVNLSKYDINVICLGGVVVEAPCMLFGTETVENAEKYKVDKMFFSTEALSLKGEISSGSYDLMLKTVSKNANKIFYLVDHKKIGKSFSRVYSNLSNVDYVISDYNFSAEITSAFPNTNFVNANEK